MWRSKFAGLTDFELGIRFMKCHEAVEHLKTCRACRKRVGFFAVMRMRRDLRKLNREIGHRASTMEFWTFDLSQQPERASVYEAAVNLN